MRPDRLVVGECRGPEVCDLLAALNTGHEGGCGTVHANSAPDVPARLEALALLGGSAGGAPRAGRGGLDVVLHLERDGAGRRLVGGIGVLRRGADALVEVVPALRSTRTFGSWQAPTCCVAGSDAEPDDAMTVQSLDASSWPACLWPLAAWCSGCRPPRTSYGRWCADVSRLGGGSAAMGHRIWSIVLARGCWAGLGSPRVRPAAGLRAVGRAGTRLSRGGGRGGAGPSRHRQRQRDEADLMAGAVFEAVSVLAADLSVGRSPPRAAHRPGRRPRGGAGPDADAPVATVASRGRGRGHGGIGASGSAPRFVHRGVRRPRTTGVRLAGRGVLGGAGRPGA